MTATTCKAQGQKHLIEFTHDELMVLMLALHTACNPDVTALIRFAGALITLENEEFETLQQKLIQAHESMHANV